MDFFCRVIPGCREDDSVAGEFRGESYFCRDSCLVKHETEQGSVQVYQIFGFFGVNGEEFVHIVLEISGCPVGRNNGPFVLLKPCFAPVYTDLGYRQFVSSTFVDYRDVQVLYTISCIESASVPIGLFLIVLAGLDIDYGRSQLKRAVSVRSIAQAVHLLCNGCKIGNGRQICCCK